MLDQVFSSNLQAVLIFFVVFLFVYKYLFSSPKNLPPGPRSLPIVGSLPFMSPDPRVTLPKMAAKYGDVFTIYMGSFRAVVLSNLDTIRDAFVNRTEFAGRDQNSLIAKDISNGYGTSQLRIPDWENLL